MGDIAAALVILAGAFVWIAGSTLFSWKGREPLEIGPVNSIFMCWAGAAIVVAGIVVLFKRRSLAP